MRHPGAQHQQPHGRSAGTATSRTSRASGASISAACPIAAIILLIGASVGTANSVDTARAACSTNSTGPAIASASRLEGTLQKLGILSLPDVDGECTATALARASALTGCSARAATAARTSVTVTRGGAATTASATTAATARLARGSRVAGSGHETIGGEAGIDDGLPDAGSSEGSSAPM